MRRAPMGLLAAAMVLGVAIVAGLARWPVAPDKVLAAMNEALGDDARLLWRAPSSATLSLLPWPGLTIEDVTLDDAFGLNVATAREARIGLDAKALIVGRMRPRSATLVQASLTIDIDRLPTSSASGERRKAESEPPLDGFGLMDGTVRIVSARQDFDTTLDGVDGQLSGLGANRPFSVSLAARWRGEAFAFAADVADLETASLGKPTTFSASVSSARLDAALRGGLSGGGDLAAEGSISVKVMSLSSLARLFGTSRSRFLAADDLAFHADVKAGGGALELRNVVLESAGQELEGALTLSLANGRAKVAGSLAADRLALAPLFGAPSRWRDPGGGWASQPFAFAPPRGADVDIRLSAGDLDVFGQRFTNVAASAIAGDGRLAVALAEATYAQGRLAGEASLERSGGPLVFRASGSLSGADLGQFFGGFGWPGNSGRGNLAASIEANGDSPTALLSSVAGWATLGATDGALTGIDLEEALRRSQRHAIDPMRDLRPGAVAFQRLDASIILASGVAAIASARMQGAGLAATASGAVDVAGQAWRTMISAQQTDAAGRASPDAARLTIDVDGPWAAPWARASRPASD